MIVQNQDKPLEEVGHNIKRKILASGGNMMSVEVHFKKGAIGQVHKHVHEQISYILEGSFEFEMDGKKQVLKKGDTYYVAPNVAHGVVALEDAVILDIFTPQREDFIKD